jgi:hypothetical protein
MSESGRFWCSDEYGVDHCQSKKMLCTLCLKKCRQGGEGGGRKGERQTERERERERGGIGWLENASSSDESMENLQRVVQKPK